ncbi:MAG: MerR family transcriptional regulator [Nakamurella sp.]
MNPPDSHCESMFEPHQAAERTGLSLDTLRYYEREGLIGPVDRTVSGRRRYTEGDLSWIGLLTCLREAGLGIADLRGFTQLLRTSGSEPTDPVAFLRRHRAGLLDRQEATRRALTVLADKIAYYDTSADSRSRALESAAAEPPVSASGGVVTDPTTARPMVADEPGTIMIVSGPPGAGKSTVAALLAIDGTRPTVLLDTDEFYLAIRTGYVAPYLPGSASQNVVVAGVCAEAAVGYARGGYDVVVDGVVGPWFLPSYRTPILRAGLRVSYVVLLPGLSTTVARARGRGEDQLRDSGPVSELHRAFESHRAGLSRHIVDSTGSDPAGTAADLRRRIAAGEFVLEDAGPRT